MSHARIEEVSDSDPEISDPEIEDPEEFLPNEVLRPVLPVVPAPRQASSAPSPAQPQDLHSAPFRPPPMSATDIQQRREAIKPFSTLYPCYFSSARTRAQGRRVGKHLATANPLAFGVLRGVRNVVGDSLKVAFEPDKTHPKDWANPGRVKVQIFDAETHEPLLPHIKNKQHLYNLVAQYLKDHPTKPQDPLDLKLQGLPVPEKFLETKVERPRGCETMNEILPVHSAAVSGGGVSDNFFKDAMEEMKQLQAQGGGGDGGMGGLASMMQGMQGLGGMGGMGGAGAIGAGGESSSGGKKKKDKKKG